MAFYGKSNRMLIEGDLQHGVLKDCQIVDCDISSLVSDNVQWSHVDIKDCHANDMTIKKSNLEDCTLFRSNAMRLKVLNSKLTGVTYDGVTLIKSTWDSSFIRNTTFRNDCFQRSQCSRVTVDSSSFTDIEALDVVMEQCIFMHSMFTITYGSGMNGFSGAAIKDCLFYNCRFEGFPLRGAHVDSCAFIHCQGQIGDDMECTNVAGIGLKGRSHTMAITNRTEAVRLLSPFMQGNR